MTDQKTIRAFVDGRFLPASDTLPIYDPSDGER